MRSAVGPSAVWSAPLWMAVVLHAALAFHAPPADGEAAERELTGRTMGTAYHVKCLLGGSAGADAQSRAAFEASLAARVEDCLEEINAKMSAFRKDSELSRFNAWPRTTPFAVSTETLEVFLMARRVSELSGGAFDITVGPIVNAYGFGAGEKIPHFPTEEETRALRERVGYWMIEADPVRATISKGRPDICCDLAAIAKGYGVDKVAEVLEKNGVRDYMVEIGGEARTKGRNAQGQIWRIGIERPADYARAVERVVALRDCSMATSGDYRNFYMVNGARICHEIDPRTGRPIQHNLASASVIHEKCAMADAFATAIMVLGPGEGAAFAERQGLAVLLIVRNPDGTLTEKPSALFKMLEERP